MDDDGSKSLSKEEFSKGIRETGLTLSDEDTEKLFSAFDKDGEGTINYDEFLVAIRVSCCKTLLVAVRVSHSIMVLVGMRVRSPKKEFKV